MELSRFRRENNKERLEWVKFWVAYMRKNPNKVWSREQADFINSVMRSADARPDNYLKVKKIVEKR